MLSLSFVFIAPWGYVRENEAQYYRWLRMWHHVGIARSCGLTEEWRI